MQVTELLATLRRDVVAAQTEFRTAQNMNNAGQVYDYVLNAAERKYARLSSALGVVQAIAAPALAKLDAERNNEQRKGDRL